LEDNFKGRCLVILSGAVNLKGRCFELFFQWKITSREDALIFLSVEDGPKGRCFDFSFGGR
jgi:hypothetical protein